MLLPSDRAYHGEGASPSGYKQLKIIDLVDMRTSFCTLGVDFLLFPEFELCHT
jgi:hypothetical protein